MINFKSSQFIVMMDFVGVLMYSTSYEITSDRKIHLTLDLKNTFIIPLDDLSIEDENLIQTLFNGLRYGANFETRDIDFKDFKSIHKYVKLSNKSTKIVYFLTTLS